MEVNRVRVKAFGTLRSRLGGQEVEVDLPEPCNLKHLLDIISRHWAPELLETLVDPRTQELRELVHVFVNQEETRHLQGLDTPLSSGDVVLILQGDFAGGSPLSSAETGC